MKKLLLEQKSKTQFLFSLCLIFLCSSLSWGQTVSTLPVYEPFSYTDGSSIFYATVPAPSSTALIVNQNGQGPWSTSVAQTKDATLIVPTPDWVNTGLSGSYGGSALQIKGSGADPELLFTPTIAGFGAIYSSFAMSVTAQASAILQPTAIGGYFYGMASGGSKRSVVFLRMTVANTYQIGISTATAGTAIDWCPTNFSVGDKIFVVVKYTDSGDAIMFVNPDINLHQRLLGFQKSSDGSSSQLPDRILINQNSNNNTPQIVIDEIRVANNWGQALGGAATVSPTVEKKQAFNSSSNPTVASLIATGAGTMNWYSSMGGTVLATDTSLASGTYYVTQTVNGIESDMTSSSVYVGDTSLKTLPLYEPFNYVLGDKLVAINKNTVSGTGDGSWSVGTTVLPDALSVDDIVIAAQPGTWTSTVLPDPSGKALTFVGSGLDPELLFTAPTTGSVYASCLFMVTSLLSNTGATSITNATSGTSLSVPPAPGQIFSFAYADTPAGSTSSYTAAVYLKASTVDAAKFNIGINAAPADPIVAGDILWDATDYVISTPITLVIRYSYDDLISKLWINPTSNAIEPVANQTTLARVGAIAADRVRLTQSSSATTPFITFDELRVANNWGQALGGDPTLGVAKIDVSKFTVYPNPVTNGKLYISSESSSEKQVAIYSILGQKVLDAKTSNNSEINVSNLAKGAYILTVTEEGKTDSKKLIIQ